MLWHIERQRSAGGGGGGGGGECHRGGSAKLGKYLLASLGQCPEWGWKRGVVDVVTWGHQQRALRRLLKGGRAIGHCTLVSGLSSVLEGIANMKVITSAEGASATSPRPDGATGYTGCTVEMAQLPNAFWKQLLSPVFGDAHCDQTSEQQIVNRDAAWQESWAKHLLNPTLAFGDVLRRVAVRDDADSLKASGSRT